MPISPTFPGVYIDELPNAVRTIVGVPTSTAAFVGTAPRGATDRPVHITSFADYEKEFGGLDPTSDMSHAVYQFYLNGGADAEIVRVVRTENDPNDTTTPAPELAAIASAERDGVGGGPITFHAADEGDWPNGGLRVRVDYGTAEVQTDPAQRKTYNLTVFDKSTGTTERFLNVSIEATSPDSVANVLASSRLLGKVDNANFLPVAHSSAGLATGADPFQDGHGTGTDAWYSEASGGADGAPPVAFQFLGGTTGEADKTGIFQLLKADIFNMLCLPGDLGVPGNPSTILTQAAALCLQRRAMLIADPPKRWDTVDNTVNLVRDRLPVTGDAARNTAFYFPRINVPDPSQKNAVRTFPPCGMIAGIWSRTDVQRGVWKAPAGTEAGMNGVDSLSVPLTDAENGRLNPLGVNCLRTLPVFGNVVWGARTAKGADVAADQWKYIPVRRLALFIEESLFRGTQWVVFEPNDEPLWSSIRLNVGAFMNNLFRNGAFQGRTPQEAYLVKCDATNNPQNDIDRGIVNILVGFAPLKPAEFVIIHIQQLAGQIQV